MNKNLLKSAVLALTLTATIATSAVPAFAVSVPNISAVAYSATAPATEADVFDTIDRINAKIPELEALIGQLEPKTAELETFYFNGINEKTVVKALRALLAPEKDAIAAELEIKLYEITIERQNLSTQLSEADLDMTTEAMAEQVRMNALMKITSAVTAIMNYESAVDDLNSAINYYDTRINS